MSSQPPRRRAHQGEDYVDPSLFLSRSYENVEDVLVQADQWAERRAALEASKARPWGAVAKAVKGAPSPPKENSLKGGSILEIMASVSTVKSTATATTTATKGDGGAIVPVKKKKKKLKKRPPLPPLLKTSNPVVRIDAASTVLRPPRASFGYCAISGSFRDHFTTGGLNKPADRLLVCDNFLGCNEQSLFGCFEGIGINGSKTADFLATALPAVVEAVAAEHSKRRKRKAEKSGPVSFGAPKDPIARLNVAAKSILQFLADSDDDEAGPPDLKKGPGGKPPAHPSKQAPRKKKKIIEKLADVSADVVSRVHSILAGGVAGANTAAASLGLAPGTLDLPDGRYNGASLCFALIRGDNLVVANVGGCRAVIGAEVDAVAVAALLPNAPAVAAARGGGGGSPRSRSASPSRVGTAGGAGALTTMGDPNSSIAIMSSQEMQAGLSAAGSMAHSTGGGGAGHMAPNTSHSARTGLSHLGEGGDAMGGGDAIAAAAPAAPPPGGGSAGSSVPRTIRLLQDVSVMDISVLRAPGAVPALAKHAVDTALGKHNKGSLFKGGSRAASRAGNGPDLTPEQAAAALGLVAGGSSTLLEAAARKEAVLHPASTADFPALPPVVRDALWFPEETYVEPVKALSLHRAAAVQARRAEVGERIVRIAAKTGADYASLSEHASITDLPSVDSMVATLPNGPSLVAAASMTDALGSNAGGGGGSRVGTGGILKMPGGANAKKLPSLRLVANGNASCAPRALSPGRGNNNSLPPSAVGSFRLPSASGANGAFGRSPSRRTVLHDSLSLHDGGGSLVAPSNWHSLSVLDKVRGSAITTELEHPSISNLKERRLSKEQEEVKRLAAANIVAAAEAEQEAIRKQIEEQQSIMAGYANFTPGVPGAVSKPGTAAAGATTKAGEQSSLDITGAVSAVDTITAGGEGGKPSVAAPSGFNSQRRLSDAQTVKSELTKEGSMTNSAAYIPILATTKVSIKELRPPGGTLPGSTGGIVKGDGSGVGGPVGNAVITLQTLVASPFAVDFSVPPVEHADMPLAEEVRHKYSLLYQHQAHLAGRPPPGAEKPPPKMGGIASKLAALKNGGGDAASDRDGRKTPNSPGSSSPQSPRGSRSPSRSPSQLGSRGVSFAGGGGGGKRSPSPGSVGGGRGSRSPSPGGGRGPPPAQQQRSYDEYGSDDLFRSELATPAGNQNPARGWLRTPKDAAYVKSFGDNLRNTMSGDLRQAVAAVSGPSHASFSGGPARNTVDLASRDSMTFEARKAAAAKDFEQSNIGRAYRVRPFEGEEGNSGSITSGLAGLLMEDAFGGADGAESQEMVVMGRQESDSAGDSAVGLITSDRNNKAGGKTGRDEPEVIAGIIIPVIPDVPSVQPFPGMEKLNAAGTAAAAGAGKPQLPRLNLPQGQQHKAKESVQGAFGIATANGTMSGSFAVQQGATSAREDDSSNNNILELTKPARGDSITSTVSDPSQQKAVTQLMADAAAAAFAGMNIGSGTGLTRLARGLQSGIVGLSKRQTLAQQNMIAAHHQYQLQHQEQMQALTAMPSVASSLSPETEALKGMLDMTPRGLIDAMGTQAVPHGRHAKAALAKAIADAQEAALAEQNAAAGLQQPNPQGKYTAADVVGLAGFGGLLEQKPPRHASLPKMLPPPGQDQPASAAAMLLPGSASSSIIDFGSIGTAPSFAADEQHQHQQGQEEGQVIRAGTAASEGGATLTDAEDENKENVHSGASAPSNSPPSTSPSGNLSLSPSRSGLRTSGTFGARSGILVNSGSPSRIGTSHARSFGIVEMGPLSPSRHGGMVGGADPMGNLPKPPAPAYLQDIRYYNDAGKPIKMCLPLVLTIDHRPDRPEETARVLASGGRVAMAQYEGGRRGHLPRVYSAGLEGPGLTVSRCVGYTSAATLGVIPVPDVITHKIQPNDRFMIVASDGLWAVLSSEEAVRIVGKTIDSVLWGGAGDPKLQAIAALERQQRAAAERERLVEEAASDAEEETARQLLPVPAGMFGDAPGSPSSPSSPGPPSSLPGTAASGSRRLETGNSSRGSKRGDETALATASSMDSTNPPPSGFITGSTSLMRAGLTDSMTLESTITARNQLVDGSWVEEAASSLFSNPALSTEDAKLIADAVVLDPTKAPQQRSVAAAIAHPAPLTHETPSPAIEARISISAGEGPAAGSGGGTAMPMDLAESLLPEQARALRLQRRRTTSLAAAEALIAAARVKWKESMGGNHNNRASSTPWDDIAVMVILFEH